MTQETSQDTNPPLRHPGPQIEPRINAATTTTQRFEIALTAGGVFETAVLEGFAKAGFESGYLEITDLACTRIDYVIPARSETPDRLAWYSTPRAPQGPATIAQGFMSIGRYKTGGFTHCHGLWHLADGGSAMGHLLSHETIIARDCVLQAVGFDSAQFLRRPDDETRFEIFAAIETSKADRIDAIIATLRPNTDIATACAQLCAEHGIARARVIGLGSLNGASFQNAARMRDHVSEFLIRSGEIVQGEAQIDIAVVDSHANQFLGQIIPGKAGVSVTAELVIIPA